MTLADAQEKMELRGGSANGPGTVFATIWLGYDNTERQRGSIGDKSPCELANPGPASGPGPSQTPETPASGDPKSGLTSNAGKRILRAVNRWGRSVRAGF